jgi:hypothetical protein
MASRRWEDGAPAAVWYRVACESEWPEWNELPFDVGIGGGVDSCAGIALDHVVEEATQIVAALAGSPPGIRRPTSPRIRFRC